MSRPRLRSLVLLAILVLSPLAARSAAGQGASPADAIDLFVDGRDVARRVLHVRERVPLPAGPRALVYPRWIPGDHGPTGPIGDLVELAITGPDGVAIPWRRDPLDVYRITFDVPTRAGAGAGPPVVEVRFDLVIPPKDSEGAHPASATSELAILSWNEVVLAPEGTPIARTTLRAHLRVPADWKVATSLTEVSGGVGEGVHYAPVSLEELIDSPVLLGRRMKTFDLTPAGGPPHRVVFAADSDEALRTAKERVPALRALVREGLALFGRAPFRAYTFLVALSDGIDHFGLEHLSSSDNRVPERTLLDDSEWLGSASLLPHEYVHAWNGKFRRPVGLVRDDYQSAQDTRDLWIYEGLTEYWGWVLAARAGLETRAQAEAEFSYFTGAQETRVGRRWRSLEDVSLSAQTLDVAPSAFTAKRRSLDYYGEGYVLWLEVDAIIRRQTRGRRSLDDIAPAFFAPRADERPGGGGPRVRAYTESEFVAALAAICPHDWAAHFERRVRAAAPHLALEGLTLAGWRLAYADSANPYVGAVEASGELTDLRWSLGMRVSSTGGVIDVVPDSPADRAGLAPGDALVAVDGREWSKQTLEDALRAAGRDSTHATIELLAKRGPFLERHDVDGRSGMRAPLIVRAGGADALARILAPRARRAQHTTRQ